MRERSAGRHPDDLDEPVDDEQSEPGLSQLPVHPRTRGLLLLIGGVVGFAASFTLTLERFILAGDPSYVPSCSLNPVLSCGNIMTSAQAALFGFPNPLLGLPAFTVMTLLGVLVLAGTPLPRRVEQAFGVGVAAGTVFVGWLISQSLYSIHSLCPYCMVVWSVMVVTAWMLLADALHRGLLPVPTALRPLARAVVDYRLLGVLLTFLLVAVLITEAFWSYWVTLL